MNIVVIKEFIKNQTSKDYRVTFENDIGNTIVTITKYDHEKMTTRNVRLPYEHIENGSSEMLDSFIESEILKLEEGI